MRFITTKTHAVNDYIFGAMLIIIPLMYRETTGGAAVWVPVMIGAFVLMQSLLTDYEISLARLLPIKAHLAMDALTGLVLAASPWMFGFAEVVWIPHVAVGVIEVLFAITTQLHRSDPVRAGQSRNINPAV